MTTGNDIRRGQVYHIIEVPFAKPVGSEIWPGRPAVVVSNDVLNANSGVVCIVYLTRSNKKRTSPTHVPVTSDGKPAIALCEQIHCIDKSKLGGAMGELTEDEMHNISIAMSLTLDVTGLKSTTGWLQKWSRYIEKYDLSVTPDGASSANAEKLQQQIRILERERDGFKALYEAREAELQAIRTTV